MEPPSSLVPAGAEDSVPDVIIADPRWRRWVRQPEALVRRAVHAARDAADEPGGMPDAVMLSSDRHVRQLNLRHRGRNKPTNVLTFESLAGGGDIVVALGVLRREAAAARRRPAHHLAHLVVHGALHLRGHDHHGAGEARRMEMQETRILHRLRVPNPWRRA